MQQSGEKSQRRKQASEITIFSVPFTLEDIKENISITTINSDSKYSKQNMLWYWGADPNCVGNKMRTMRCNEDGDEPEGNEAELIDWISRYGEQSTLVVDCRESIGMPLTVTPLLDLLINMPCPVLAIVDDVNGSYPFPAWTPC